MAGRDVYFYANSTDFDEVLAYYESRGEDEGPPTDEVVAFVEALQARLAGAGLSEDEVFEPSAGLDLANAEGPGMYVIFEMNDASTRAQKIAFTVAREMSVGTLDCTEVSDGWDSTEHYYALLQKDEGHSS